MHASSMTWKMSHKQRMKNTENDTLHNCHDHIIHICVYTRTTMEQHGQSYLTTLWVWPVEWFVPHQSCVLGAATCMPLRKDPLTLEGYSSLLLRYSYHCPKNCIKHIKPFLDLKLFELFNQIIITQDNWIYCFHHRNYGPILQCLICLYLLVVATVVTLYLSHGT